MPEKITVLKKVFMWIGIWKVMPKIVVSTGLFEEFPVVAEGIKVLRTADVDDRRYGRNEASNSVMFGRMTSASSQKAVSRMKAPVSVAP